MAWPTDPKERDVLMRSLGMDLGGVLSTPYHEGDLLDALKYGMGFSKTTKHPAGFTVGEPIALREVFDACDGPVIDLAPSEYRRVK
jgi:hypothetical protein